MKKTYLFSSIVFLCAMTLIGCNDESKESSNYSSSSSSSSQSSSSSSSSSSSISPSSSSEPTKYNLSVTSEDELKGSVSIVSGSGYAGESITIKATPCDTYSFDGWYEGTSAINDETTYTFEMPAKDYSLVAYFERTDEWNKTHGVTPVVDTINKTVTYGLYPQTNVNDESLLASLNALTTPESNGWYLFENEYYAKTKANPYATSYTFDNGTTIVKDTTYWFKCEPITWNILSENDGSSYYLLSSKLLDAQRYGESYSGTKSKTDYQGNTADVYANNYQYSDIRTWLNTTFYNSAFNLDNSKVLTTTVDNSAATTDKSSNEFACDPTNDKVFLPSYQDYANNSYGFDSSTNSSLTRYCKTTDYARAVGSYSCSLEAYLNNGYYFMRSPYSYNSMVAWDVYYQGNFGSGSTSANDSVRPAISLSLT